MMSSRLITMRQALKAELIRHTRNLGSHRIESQIGMFTYTGLSARQVEHLADQYHVYLLPSGRMNVCGVNCANVDYFARAIEKLYIATRLEKYPHLTSKL